MGPGGLTRERRGGEKKCDCVCRKRGADVLRVHRPWSHGPFSNMCVLLRAAVTTPVDVPLHFGLLLVNPQLTGQRNLTLMP